MIHFLTHVNSGKERDWLPNVECALKEHFPDSQLTIINQTPQGLPHSLEMENIKPFGFAWTLRFLQHAQTFLQADDLLIKIDPDIMIHGNPLVPIPAGNCFGQIKRVCGDRVFLGCFQGYTTEALNKVLEYGQRFANEQGAQDVWAYQALLGIDANFTALPHIDLWADPRNYDMNAKILTWKKQR